MVDVRMKGVSRMKFDRSLGSKYFLLVLPSFQESLGRSNATFQPSLRGAPENTGAKEYRNPGK